MSEYVNTLDTILAFFIPIFVGYLSKRSWSSNTKGLISFALAVVVSCIRTYLEGKFNAQDLATSVVYVLVMSEVFYQKLLKDFAQSLQDTGFIKDKPSAPVIVEPSEPAS